MYLGIYLIIGVSLLGLIFFVRHCILEKEFQSIKIGDKILVYDGWDGFGKYTETVTNIYTDEDGYTMVIITNDGNEYDFNDYTKENFSIL